ncbi:hypothetical protein CERZMDRAFT_8298, partial [Cercospora zeae-maydis SCOH1-5]
RLDTLWAHYLDLLDDYTTAQAAIKEHMASGYFALAQANFKSSRGRYGHDYYDERAAAITRAVLNSQDESVSIKIQKHVVLKEAPSTQDSKSSETHERALSDDEQDTRSTETSQPMQIPTPAATPEPESKQESIDSIETAKPQADLHDPIRWFGILVPPTLRQAQKSFTNAILDSSSLEKAANSSRRMREVEVEIGKLRKVIKK